MSTGAFGQHQAFAQSQSVAGSQSALDSPAIVESPPTIDSPATIDPPVAIDPQWLLAQQQTVARPLLLDPLVVTATRSPARVSDVVADVTVIDQAAIEAQEGRTLVELLSQAPGLQFTANGGLGKVSSLFVRGLEARHVLLLIDGVRLGSATLNSASLDNLPLDAIERIEIVRGPMTSLYGSNAMAGVVQIFTRKGKPGVFGNARLGVGSNGYGVAAGGVNYGTTTFDIAAQAQYQRTDGFSATSPQVAFGSHDPDDDGFEQEAGSLRAGWNITRDWRLEGLWLDSRGKTQFDDGPGVDTRATILNRVQSLQIAGPVTSDWRTQVAFGRSVDSFDVLASANGPFSLGETRTDQTQLSWENRLALPLGEALVLAERVEQSVSRPGEPYAVSDRNIDALGLGWSANVGAHDFATSLRHDRYSQFDGKTTGALAYAYALTPAWRAGGSYGTSFTAPSFNQLYYPGFGNPDLQPEEGRHGEVFVQWQTGSQRIRLTQYENRYDGFIGGGPQPTNIPQVEISGTSIAWDRAFKSVTLSSSFDYIDPRNTTSDGVDAGKLLPRRAQRALKVAADWSIGAWRLGATWNAYSERFDDTANTIRLGGYGIVDLRADRQLSPAWSLGLRVNNVGDKPYETAYGYNQARREGFVTLRWSPR